MESRGSSRQVLPSEETSRRWGPAGVVLKRTGTSLRFCDSGVRPGPAQRLAARLQWAVL